MIELIQRTFEKILPNSRMIHEYLKERQIGKKKNKKKKIGWKIFERISVRCAALHPLPLSRVILVMTVRNGQYFELLLADKDLVSWRSRSQIDRKVKCISIEIKRRAVKIKISIKENNELMNINVVRQSNWAIHICKRNETKKKRNNKKEIEKFQ